MRVRINVFFRRVLNPKHALGAITVVIRRDTTNSPDAATQEADVRRQFFIGKVRALITPSLPIGLGLCEPEGQRLILVASSSPNYGLESSSVSSLEDELGWVTEYAFDAPDVTSHVGKENLSPDDLLVVNSFDFVIPNRLLHSHAPPKPTISWLSKARALTTCS